MLHAVVSKLPPRVVRAIGRAQFRSPLVAWMVRISTGRLTSEGTIPHGAGAGLRFDAAGGYPGYLLGTSEPEEQAFLTRHLSSGGVFYDVGANIGFYSTIAARVVGPTGQVFAFEPHPESAASAGRNATLNGFKNVTVVPVAVGDHDDRMTLGLGTSSAAHRLDSGPGIDVEVISLDDWIRRTRSRPPTLVMIDVEGAELNVLEGMREILAQHQPTICCEVHWLGNEFLDYCSRELKGLGYTVTGLDNRPPPSGLKRWHAALHPAQ